MPVPPLCPMANFGLVRNRVQWDQCPVQSLAGGLLSLVAGAASDVTVFGEVFPGLVINAAISLGKGNLLAGIWKWLITSHSWLRVCHQHQPQHLSAPGSRATYPRCDHPLADSAPKSLLSGTATCPVLTSISSHPLQPGQAFSVELSTPGEKSALLQPTGIGKGELEDA